jgi:hypothetical protein
LDHAARLPTQPLRLTRTPAGLYETSTAEAADDLIEHAVEGGSVLHHQEVRDA